METDCIFCKIIAGEMPAQKIYENDQVLAFLDIRPTNPGHTLIVPKNHAANYLESPLADVVAVLEAARKIAPAALKAVGAEAVNTSFNTGRAAGQIIFHTHLHLIPRFATDGYKQWTREGDEHVDLAAMAEKIKEQLI
jgi:histidine triad (HIT) family protein